MKDWALFAKALHVHRGKTPILWDLSLQIPRGKIVGILGPNGAGKSTLLQAALGLTPIFSGVIELGDPLSSGKVAYVPQRDQLDWDFPMTAEEMVLMGRYGKLRWMQKARQADWDACAKALDLVQMTPFAKRQIGQLSKGQQQRLFFARAWVQYPEIYIFDEILAGVDMATEKVILSLLEEEKKRGKTIFLVHHDLSTVQAYFDWVVLLHQRLVASGPTEETFTVENIEHTFGKGHSLFTEAAQMAAKNRSGIS